MTTAIELHGLSLQRGSGAPNLDGMPDGDLHLFAQYTRGLNPRKIAKHLFPENPRGRVRATRDLNHYTWNLITARACRQRGDIQTAQMYEDICERIYTRLPEWAKW